MAERVSIVYSGIVSFWKEKKLAGDKIKMDFEINTDSKVFLESVTEKYGLPNSSKALRCLLDFAATDGNLDDIFKKIRCNRCG